MAQTTLRDYLQSTEDAIGSGRIDEAFNHCQHMLTHFPESLEAQRLLGEVYLAQGQLADAQQTFDWVLTNDPENVIAYCDRALMSERMADYETALDCYQQAYELSRGNSQIRQEFNILSAKIGQQGFIFSRAGLARLYMRGDLLPQAMQEWETVLTSSPDRLDARTGLLETYWREGLYDQVEQLARDILNDVPHCLKALLLLAHVAFAQNVTTSQELLQRAEALDPELTMASELFSDLLASQPHDPFLALLQKGPPTDTSASNGHSATATPPGTPTQPVSNPSAANKNADGSHSTSEFSDSLLHWSSLDIIIEPQQDYQIMQDASAPATWSGSQQPESNSWHALSEQEQYSAREAEQHAGQEEHNMPGFDNWTMPGQSGANWPTLETQPMQHAVNDEELSANEQSSLFTDSAEEPQMDSGDEDFAQWSNAHPLTSSNASSTWEEKPTETNLSAPPPWLDMLTRGEQRRQPNDSAPTFPTDAPTAIEPSIAGASGVARSFNEQQNETPEMPAVSQQDDETDFFFGPDWLKSLGATSMDTMDTALSPASLESQTSEEAQETLAPAHAITPVMATPPIVNEHFFTQQEEDAIMPAEPEPVAQQPASDVEPITPFFGWAPEQSAWERQTLLANAEQPTPEVAQTPSEIEPDNASEPSVPQTAKISPAAPEQKQRPSVEEWLAQAAQKLSHPEQNMLVTLEELEKDLHAQGFTQLEPGSLATIARDEPTLSSALAQLGNYGQQPSLPNLSTGSTESTGSAPAQTVETPLTPVSPLWTATPEPVAQANPPVQETQPASTMPSHLDMLSSFTSQAWPKLPDNPSPAAEPKVPIPEQVAQPVARISPAAPAPNVSSAQVPTMRPDALLDMELETTMKRPAVRLQPIPPQRHGTARGGHMSERPTSSKLSSSGDLTHKERLLKGYQYQLAGAYDNAMQEYRIIIRNAPELLDEVVSNMRALLKLAPKYSAGFRVLGDAYMRQGEYLHAMEAYNKALTMAKKAKS